MNDSDKLLLKNAEKFLFDLEKLRDEIVSRDLFYKQMRQSKDPSAKQQYEKVAQDISLKCLFYATKLIASPTPSWIERIPREYAGLADQFFSVVCDQMCASVKVFDKCIIPNTKALIRLAFEETYSQ
jgi:hypothetical protein